MSTNILNRNHPVLIDHALAATTGQINIPVDHMIELNYGLTAVQNGGTAPSLADMKGDIIDELVMTLGGVEFVRLDNYDITILQNLWFGQTPHHLLSAGDNCFSYFSPVTLPLSLDKSLAGGLRKATVQWTIGAQTDVDDVRLDAAIPYISNADVSWLPNGYHYAYQYKTFTASTTRQTIPFDRAGADLLGLLVYSCTIPTAALLNISVDTLTILVNGQPTYGPVEWMSMPTFQCTQNVLDDTTYGAELDNYRYLDFSKAPLPADDLDIWTTSLVATDAGQKFIGVFMEP